MREYEAINKLTGEHDFFYGYDLEDAIERRGEQFKDRANWTFCGGWYVD